ncbi:hypothetical protein [Rufibacter sp. XAAS-G3-1]|uniref:hypothetical protein n=1 Tax=Rufibacter sp. XAAS-G3-1 TaxID=2729134 RepID=UPI001C627816|nr:hypothetical protein [Rufibacter sp. XAAS-G3-1]
MKKTAAGAMVLVLLFSSMPLYAQEMGNTYVNNPVVKSGVGLGSVLAVVTSWTRNRSLLWAIFHAIIGWVYVGYFQITRRPEERRF